MPSAAHPVNVPRLAPSCPPSAVRAQREKVLKQATEGATDDGSYKGMNAYIDYRKVGCGQTACEYMLCMLSGSLAAED